MSQSQQKSTMGSVVRSTLSSYATSFYTKNNTGATRTMDLYDAGNVTGKRNYANADSIYHPGEVSRQHKKDILKVGRPAIRHAYFDDKGNPLANEWISVNGEDVLLDENGSYRENNKEYIDELAEIEEKLENKVNEILSKCKTDQIFCDMFGISITDIHQLTGKGEASYNNWLYFCFGKKANDMRDVCTDFKTVDCRPSIIKTLPRDSQTQKLALQKLALIIKAHPPILVNKKKGTADVDNVDNAMLNIVDHSAAMSGAEANKERLLPST